MSDPSAGQQYARWKMAIPVLYDWFTNHSLTWPSLSCRWAAPVEDSAFRRKQLMYLSERTDGSDPNKLMLVPVELCKPRVAAAETIAGFHETNKSPFVKPAQKTILHQGEVNKIREVPGNTSIVATHSDAKEVFIWHFDRQPHREEKKGDRKKLSEPDLTLTGHKENAEFALSVSSASPTVASGGHDKCLLLWNLLDYDGGSLVNGTKSPPKANLAAGTVLQGHADTIEDVVFLPGSSQELASVGDDFALFFWDTRAGSGPSLKLAEAHGQQDVQCLDWSSQDMNFVASGAADGSLKVWDRRQTKGAAFTFNLHSKPLTRVEWAPYRPGILASGGEDGVVCVWDLNHRKASGNNAEMVADAAKSRASLPSELLFQHAGHQAGIADFQWHPEDPFTMVSVSDNLEGGTLQMWRINDLIYRPEAEVLAELEQFRDEVLPKEKAGKPDAKRRRSASPLKNNAEPPKPTGGSAPAATPARAFVGVPEGVAVTAEVNNSGSNEMVL